MRKWQALTIILTLLVVVSIQAREPLAYVINTSGETLSKINLETGQVTNNILTLGSDINCYPGQIVVRDTLAYVLNSGTDEIQLINLNTESTIGFIDLGVDASPFWMAFLDSQYVYVTSFQYDKVMKVDAISREVVDEIPVGMSPEGVIICDHKVYIAVTAFNKDTWQFGQGKVVVLNPETDEIEQEIPVGTNPQYMAVDSLGRVHVVCTGDYWSVFGEIDIIDTESGVLIDEITTGGSPGAITIGPNNIAHIAAGGWYGDGYVYSYNALSGDIYYDAASPLVVDSGCMMAVAYQDSTTYVGAFEDYVTRIDADGAELARYAVGDGPVHMDVNYMPGDLSGDFNIEIVDLVLMVNWFFKDGLPPQYARWRANVNGAGGYDIADLVYLVNYMFKEGPPPKMGSTWWF